MWTSNFYFTCLSFYAEHVQGLAGTKTVTYWPSYVIVAAWFSCGMPTLTASINWKVDSKTPWCSCAGQRLDLSLLLELAKAVYCCTIITHQGNVFRWTNWDFLWLVGWEKVSESFKSKEKVFHLHQIQFCCLRSLWFFQAKQIQLYIYRPCLLRCARMINHTITHLRWSWEVRFSDFQHTQIWWNYTQFDTKCTHSTPTCFEKCYL